MGSVFLPGPESGCLGTSTSHFLLMDALDHGLVCRWDRQLTLTQLTTQAATLGHVFTPRTSRISQAWEKLTSFSLATNRRQNHQDLSSAALKVFLGMYASGGLILNDLRRLNFLDFCLSGFNNKRWTGNQENQWCCDLQIDQILTKQ